MARTVVHSQGSARVEITGDLVLWGRRILDAATEDVVRIAEAELEEVAEIARAEWYGPGSVQRITGKSGDIQVVTTINTTTNTVRVYLGSTDQRPAGKSGKPVPLYVHRPSPNALDKVQVTPDEYWATPELLRSNYKPLPPNPTTGWKGDEGTGPYVWKRSARASDGKFLVAELINKPGRKKVKLIAAALAEKIRARIGGS